MLKKWLRVGSPRPLLVGPAFMTFVELEESILISMDADPVRFTTVAVLYRWRFGQI